MTSNADLGDGMRARLEEAEARADRLPIDDRIVLPLAQTRRAARLLCIGHCDVGGHRPPCLIPLIERRDALLGELAFDQISGDCEDPVKHGACSGCACPCHRHSARSA